MPMEPDNTNVSHHLRFKQTFGARPLRIAAGMVILTGDSVAHDHDFMEVVVITAGRGVHRSIHGDQAVTAGDAFILRPGAWHAYLECEALHVFNCCFAEEVLHREMAWALEDPIISNLLGVGVLARSDRNVGAIHLKPAALKKCSARLRELSTMCQGNALENHAQRAGMLLVFLGELAGHAAPCCKEMPRSRPLHPAVAHALRLFEADVAVSWTLGELADTLDIDESHLCRRFKAATGLPPLAFLARLRAEKAAALLLRDHAPIADIGRAVGWPDPNYFARRFRARFGLSASAYRSRFAVGTNAVEAPRGGSINHGSSHRAR